jgi:YD repeat-containing protein
MAYIPFTPDGLTPATQGSAVPVIAQANDNALIDDLALYDALGWSHTETLDTQNRTIQEFAQRGNRVTRCDLTYVSAGPSVGEVETETYYESGDGGVTWNLRSDPEAPNATRTYQYDSAGNWIGETWS